jgi:prephenate dehydrogenase
MAGSEKRGVRYASADLFDGAVCITTPTQRTDPAALATVEALWRDLGMDIRRLAPEEHDRRLADVSHLPHALAAALVRMQDEQSLELSGNGFRDMTRIAAGDGALWRDIMLDNRDNLRESLERLRSELDIFLTYLDNSDADAVKAWLDAAATRREGMAPRPGPR